MYDGNCHTIAGIRLGIRIGQRISCDTVQIGIRPCFSGLIALGCIWAITDGCITRICTPLIQLMLEIQRTGICTRIYVIVDPVIVDVLVGTEFLTVAGNARIVWYVRVCCRGIPTLGIGYSHLLLDTGGSGIEKKIVQCVYVILDDSLMRRVEGDVDQTFVVHRVGVVVYYQIPVVTDIHIEGFPSPGYGTIADILKFKRFVRCCIAEDIHVDVYTIRHIVDQL